MPLSVHKTVAVESRFYSYKNIANVSILQIAIPKVSDCCMPNSFVGWPINLTDCHILRFEASLL